jgi:vacuolar-type H+-ATPase subunit I/STV1
MKKQKLREEIALREKKLRKIARLADEKVTLERELSDLRAELGAIEEEQDEFLEALEEGGYTIDEACKKLGIEK